VKISGYTPGSMYKRFYGTNMSQMNRAAVASASSAMSSYGATVFDTNLSQRQGISQLVVQQYAARITEEAKAKLQGASSIQSILASLGASSG
jgi:3-oxoacyl-[acyl-carrier-protein] synthase III